MEFLLIVGFGAVLFMMWILVVAIVKAIGRGKATNEEVAALVVFHCIASGGGQIFQSEECVIKADCADRLRACISDEKCKLTEKHRRPMIVQQIVKL